MQSFLPTQKNERIEVVDALRGLALFAIFIANLPFAENPDVVYQTRDFVLGTTQTDMVLNALFHMLIDKKFVAIFSILFGFGFYVQLQKAEQKGIDFKQYFFIRMLLLLAIASAHAYLLWMGDIIRDYAICGMLLLLVYKWRQRKLLVTGITSAVVLTAIIFIVNGVVGVNYAYDIPIAHQHPLTGSYWNYLKINARIDPFVNFLQDSPITLVFAFGCMVIGASMAKAGFFHRPKQFSGLMKKLIIAGIVVGLACSYLFWMINIGTIELTPALIWLPLVIVGGLLLQSLFYISAFIQLFQRTWFKKLVAPFALIGRMALTNYILQSVFFLFIFFHCTQGFKLYGKITLTETYLLAVGLFLLQVLFSKWWLARFKQGPIESLWKKLAYTTGVHTIKRTIPA